MANLPDSRIRLPYAILPGYFLLADLAAERTICDVGDDLEDLGHAVLVATAIPR